MSEVRSPTDEAETRIAVRRELRGAAILVILMVVPIVALAVLIAAFVGGSEGDSETQAVSDSTTSDSTTSDSSAGALVGVSLGEWFVEPEQASAPADGIGLTISNDGDLAHDLAVIRTDQAPDDLPIERHEVVEDDLDVVGQLSNIEPGTDPTLDVSLRAGQYVLICNIPGHYEQGMHGGLTVE